MHTTADELLRFMLVNLRLATYDASALNNFWYNRISKGLPLTTNQDDLFRKIVKTYQRQLSLLGISVSKATEIPWTVHPVPSSIDHQIARIYLTDNKLIVKTPFHKKFVEHMKAYTYFFWNRTERQYQTDFCPEALKLVYGLIPAYFDRVEWDPALSPIFDSINDFTADDDWNPTARLVYDRIIVSCLTLGLANWLPETLPVTLKTAAALQNAGVRLSQPVIQAVSNNPIVEKLLTSRYVEIERTNLDLVLKFLDDTDCDFLSSDFPEKSDTSKRLRSWSISRNIANDIRGTGTSLYSPVTSEKQYSHPVYFHFTTLRNSSPWSCLFTRKIKITDSTPINLYA